MRANTQSLTTGEVARRFNTSQEQVRRWIAAGDLAAIRRRNFIRIPHESLADFERRYLIGSPEAIAALLDLRERVDLRLVAEAGRDE